MKYGYLAQLLPEVDLRTVNGLDAIVHTGPLGLVDVKTVALPAGKIITIFLRSAGLTDSFIDSLPCHCLRLTTRISHILSVTIPQMKRLARRNLFAVHNVPGSVAG